MVTKKTRLMSALAVVAMLISLCSAFVLPAVAAVELAENPPVAWPAGWPETMVAYSDRTASSTETDYAITCAEDWMAAALDSNGKGQQGSGVYENFEGITLWFTGNLDFSGKTLAADATNYMFARYARENATNFRSFRGTINGQGYAFMNLDVDYNLSTNNGNYTRIGLLSRCVSATLRNLTIDETCSFKYTVEDNGKPEELLEFFCGAFTGVGEKGCTFIDCHNEADMELTRVGTESSSSSLAPFGRETGNPTMINCSNSGNIKNNDIGRATALAEWIGADGATISGCYNTGLLTTAYEGSGDFTGLISTSVKDGSSVDAISVSNSYNVGDSFACGARNFDNINAKGTTLEAGAEASGELAFLLNSNRDATIEEEYGAKYYNVTDGKITATTADKQTVKVEFYFNEELYSEAYVSMGTAIDMTTLCDIEEPTFTSTDGQISGNELTIVTLPDAYTAKIDVTTTAQVVADTTPLTDWFAAFAAAGKNTDYYSVDGTESGETLTAAIARVRENITNKVYIYSSEVEQELNNLQAYKMFKTVDISEFSVYGAEAPGYEVDSVADMEIVATNSDTLTAEQTIFITGDIDFGGEAYTGAAINLGDFKAAIDGAKAEGGRATLKNLYTPQSWLGNTADSDISHITALKNVTFENFHSTATVSNSALIIGRLYADCVIENVTLDGCSADLSGTATSVAGGLLVGRMSSVTLDLKNITIKNCALHRGDFNGVASSSYANTGMVVAKTANTTGMITVDGLYMIDNEITGLRRGNGAGIAFGEILSPVTVKNVGIFNTTVEANDGSEKIGTAETDSNVKGVLFGLIQNANCTTLSVENVITANNKVFTVIEGQEPVEEPVPLIRNYDTVSGVVIKNVYTDAAEVRTTEVAEEVIEASAVADAAAAIASGEAAYELNKLYEQKWAMTAAGIPAFSTTGLPLAITFNAPDANDPANSINEVRYTDENGKLIVEDELLFAANWEGEDPTQRVFTEETTINGALIAAHEHVWDYTYDADADTHSAVCTYGDGTCPAVIETTACVFVPIAPENTVLPADAKHTMACACGNSYEEACTTSANTTNPTCYVPGSVVTTCAVCDYEHIENLTREHNWTHTHIEGTTGDESKHLTDCAWDDCDAQEEVACTFGAWDIVGATKDQTGTKTRVCSVCGYNDVIILPKLASLDVDAGTGALGQTVTVQLNLVNNPGVAGMTVEFAYDSNVFTLIDVTAGDLNADQFVSAIKPDGTVTNKVTFANAGNITADGMIAELTFKVSATATAGDYEIVVTNTAADYDGKKVAIDNITGTITVVDFIKGDVNGDGFATLTDAVLLLRYVSGIDINMSVNEQAVDLIAEGNDTLGAVNINDVVYLLQYLNGWYESL